LTTPSVAYPEERLAGVGVRALGRVRGLQSLSVFRQACSFSRTKVGLAIVALMVAVAALGPLLAPESPTEFIAAPFSPPSEAAPFGTDYLGRDVLSRFLSGGRSVLVLALLATTVGVAAGLVVGLVAAYSSEWIDETLMRVMDVILAFPQIVFVLLMISTVGPELWLIVLTVGATHAPRVARVIRGAALEVTERAFIASAEASGESRWRIRLGEILPNVTSPLLVEFGLRLTFSIGLVAGVSFLGFGLQPPSSDWGLMVNENRVGLTVQP